MGVGNKQKDEIIADVVKLLNENTDDHITKEDIYDIHTLKARQPDTSTTNKRDTLIVSLQDAKLKRKFYALSKTMRDAHRPIYVG